MRYEQANIQAVRRAFFTKLGIVLEKLSANATQKSIALHCKVSPGTINKIIHQHRMPSLDLLVTIADKLHLDYTIEIRSYRGRKTETIEISSAAEFNYQRANALVVGKETRPS